jgi:Zn-dependent peptidase ImmA (M78 family)
MLAEGVASLETRVRFPALDLPDVPADSTPEEAAQFVRRAWGLGTAPLHDVVALLEQHGVIVSRLPAASETMDAFSSWAGARPFVILVANKQAADRARFDAAHELGHLVLRHSGTPGDPLLERLAHRFAAEFLAPEAGIAENLPRSIDWRRLAQLKLTWGVSMAMLVRRMHDLRVITDDDYKRGMIDLSRRGWRRHEPVTLGSPEEPELLARAVETLSSRQGYRIEDLARDLRVRPTHLAPFVRVWTRSRRPALET